MSGAAKSFLIFLLVLGGVGYIYRKDLQKLVSKESSVTQSGQEAKGPELPPEAAALLNDRVAKANQEGRMAVMKFSLKVCSVCDRMDREVYSKPEWQDYALNKVSVSSYTFPNKFDSSDVESSKHITLLSAIADQFKIDTAFPALVAISGSGKIIAARSGYQAGGAAATIQWLEAARAQNVVSTNKVSVADTSKATAPAASTSNPAPTPLATASTEPGAPVSSKQPAESLVLKGISGTGARRFALIGSGQKSITLAAGESGSLSTPGGPIRIQCVEIRDDRVIWRNESGGTNLSELLLGK